MSNFTAIHLILCSALLLSGPVFAADVVGTSALELYRQAQYAEAAQTGLTELLREPWNHELRFIVADSLQRTGNFDDAAMQFEALEGTPYANSASLRLNALRLKQPARTLAAAPVPVPQIPVQGPAPLAVAIADNVPLPEPTRPKGPRGSAYTVIGSPELATAAHSSAQQQILELSAAENYQAAGTQGLSLLARETPEDELRLVIANSLAWTGRLKESIQQYQPLIDGKLDKEARVGMANAYRWRGRDDQAVPLLRSVLSADPENTDAKQAMELAQRELRARTLVTLGTFDDSSDMQRRSLTVNHRWRDASGRNIFEIETSGVNDTLLTTSVKQQDLTLRYQALGLPLQPRFEISAQANPEPAGFAGLKLQFAEQAVVLDLGRVNWGKMALNANALQTSLTAAHAGVQANGRFALGQLSGHVDYYDISDNNTILESTLNFMPAWRPLGLRIKPLIGLETRDARVASTAYWSPATGFGTVYAGLVGEWNGANWDFMASGQAGRRLYGEAGPNWSVSAGGRHWLGRDLAFGLNLWDMASWRNNATYRARSLALSLEKVWN